MAKTFVCSGAESSGNISNFKGSVGRSVLISKAKAANISHDVRSLNGRTSRGILEKVHSLVALWPFNAQQELFVLSIKFRMEYQEINQQSMVMMSSD